MSKIVIKKNIDLPFRGGEFSRGARGRHACWPLAELKVGDGFEAPIAKANAIRVSIQYHQRWYKGTKFITATSNNKKHLIVKRVA